MMTGRFSFPMRTVAGRIVLGLGMLGLASVAWADTVKLKDGRTIEGQVIKRDAAQVVIEVPGGEASVSADDVESIRYPGPRLEFGSAPVTVSPSPYEPVQVDLAIVEQVRRRLLTLHRFFKQLTQVAIHVSRGQTQQAALQAHRACQWILPTDRHGGFSPASALADLVILLGLRAPLLWLALVIIGESRSFTRIAEFILLAYGVIIGLIVGISAALDRGVELGFMTGSFGSLLTGTALFGVFLWMFGLRARWSLTALLLAVALNVGTEYALLQTRWL